jgi:aspartate/methionine/tyrosine aminotransferase
MTYELDETQRWAIDLEHLERQISARTRAIV